MSIAMTGQQEKDFDENGFIILENFLTERELEALLSAVDDVASRIQETQCLKADEPFAIRNALAHHTAFLELIDHPRMLPLVVDAIGWNIQIRTSHLDYRPPYPARPQGWKRGQGGWRGPSKGLPKRALASGFGR